MRRRKTRIAGASKKQRNSRGTHREGQSSRRKELHMTNLTLYQQVINFGETATVIGFHEKTGNPILYAPGIGKWIADPGKCEIAKSAEVHKDRPVVFC